MTGGSVITGVGGALHPYPRFTPQTERALREAGWAPGRSDPTDYATPISAGGWTVHASALTFLREFGGLRVIPRRLSLTRLRREPDRDGAVELFPPPYAYTTLGESDEEELAPLAKLPPCTPIAGAGRGCGQDLYLMDVSGSIFGCMIDNCPAPGFSAVWVVGKTPEEALERFCGGGEPEEYIF